MFNASCEGRKRLVKKSLIFSHMYHEVRLIFRNSFENMIAFKLIHKKNNSLNVLVGC